MPVELSWPALLTFAATASQLYLIRVVWPYRNDPGGRLFIGTAIMLTFTTLLNGLAFVITRPVAVRHALEIAFFIFLLAAGMFWLPFALVYTGRNSLFGSYSTTAFFMICAALILLLVTNPLHHLYWSGFEVVTTFGAAGASYTRGPAMFVYYAIGGIILGGAILVLLETLLSYEQPYRPQVGALAVTSVVTWAALTAYVFELGPVPSLNFIGLSFLPHALLDAYALFYGDMFVIHPSTRRIGETAAIDEVGNPVFITDTNARLITLNDTAAEQFDLKDKETFGESLDAMINGDPLSTAESGDTVTIESTNAWREYDVTKTSLKDDSERTVGYTVALNDVTEERQRRQRLEVFDRVLRHNIRNDLNIVMGNLERIQERIDDDEVTQILETIKRTSGDLVSLSNQARTLDNLFDNSDHSWEVVQLDGCIAGVAEKIRKECSDGRIVVGDVTDAEIRTNRALLKEALREAVENGLEHNDSDVPTVQLLAHCDGDTATITVRDDGPGIPPYEQKVVTQREETDLSHGSGIGLWSIVWCIRRLGGDVELEVDEGTTIHFELPRRASSGTT